MKTHVFRLWTRKKDSPRVSRRRSLFVEKRGTNVAVKNAGRQDSDLDFQTINLNVSAKRWWLHLAQSMNDL